MNKDQAKALRAPFKPEEIGQKPQVNCRACTNAARQPNVAPRDKHCPNHLMRECQVCGNWMTSGHIHLDFVGHAAATDRLLEVDPEWTWEPMGRNPNGTPALDGEGNLWILLTVAGVTRPGCGDGPSTKEKIGDAIRNAAMRFGVALDLWTKQDLQAAQLHEAEPQEDSSTPPQSDDHMSRLMAVKRRLMAAVLRMDVDGEDAAKAWIVAEMSKRGLDKDSVADVMKLAEELEQTA